MEPKVHRLISRELCGMQVVNCRMEEFEQSQPVPTPVRTDKLGLLTSEKRKLVNGRMSLHSSSRHRGRSPAGAGGAAGGGSVGVRGETTVVGDTAASWGRQR